MLGYTYTLTNRAGQSVKINDFVTDPNNFIALQDYPLFDVDVKEAEMDKEGQNGVWDFFSFYGKRVINFSGVIIGQTEADVEDLKKLLQEITALPAQPVANTNDGYVKIEWTDANSNAWQIYAKLQRAIKFDRGLGKPLQLAFNLTMKASNPLIEGSTEVVESGVRGYETGSMKLSSILPSLIDVIYENKITLNNLGSVDAHTKIKIYGEAIGVTNPYVFNITTGKLFKVAITLADASEWIEIDSKLGTVVDQDGNDVSGLVDPTSEYIMLQVGANELVYLSDESFNSSSPIVTFLNPSAVATITFRNTII